MKAALHYIIIMELSWGGGSIVVVCHYLESMDKCLL